MQTNRLATGSDSVTSDRVITRKEKLCHMINLTESMLTFAKKGDWESLISSETERKTCMDHFFTDAISPDEIEWLKPGIEYIMGVDKQLVVLSEAAKKVIAESRNGMSKSQNAAKAYSGR